MANSKRDGNFVPGGDIGVIQQLDLTTKWPQTVAILDGSGNQITSFGGGTQYTEGDTDATITGTAILWEDAADTLTPVSSAKPLPVSVTGGGDATAANQTTIIGHVDGIEGLLTTIDADTSVLAGVDYATQTTLAAINAKLVTGTDIGDVTINNASGGSAVNIQDGGNTITVDGTVGVSGTVAVTQSGTWDEVGINDSGNSITVDGTVATTTVDSTQNGSISSSTSNTFTVGDGISAVALRVSGTWVGTIDFEGSVDATTWDPIYGVRAGVGIPYTQIDESLNDNIFRFTTAGFRQVRARFTRTSGTVTVAWRGSKGTSGVYINFPLPPGTNAIGKLVANSGVDIGDVDVTSVSGNVTVIQGTATNLKTQAESYQGGTAVGAANPLQVTLANGSVPSHAVTNAGTFAVQDSEKIADNGAFTDGTTKLMPAGYIYDEVAGTALTENDIAAPRINANRASVLTIEDGVTRGRYATVSAANALKVDNSGVTQPVSGTVAATQSGSWSLTANQSVNIAQMNGVTTTMGNGVSGTGVQRVTIASDSTGQVSLAAGTAEIGNVKNSGTFATQATLQTGSNIVGKVGIDQTTPGTTNAVSIAQLGANTISTGVGASGTGTQRIVPANDMGKTLLSAGGSASSSGNNTLIAAGSNRLKVYAFSLSTVSTTAVTCIFQSGASGTELWRVILQTPASVAGGANLVVQPPAWLFATASATLLNLNLSAAVAVNWSVSYFDEA